MGKALNLKSFEAIKNNGVEKMKCGLAVDCIFRNDYDFKAGLNWSSVYEWLIEQNILDVEINSYRRFFLTEDIYEDYLKFLSGMQAKGFRINLHNGTDGLASDSQDERTKTVNNICRDIERNRKFFQSDLLTLHPGPPCVNDDDVLRKYNYLRESLKPILEACEKAGIKIVLENMRVMYPFPGKNYALEKLLGKEKFEYHATQKSLTPFPQMGSNISLLLDFIRSFKSEKLGICIDTGHAYISEGERFYKKLEECKENLWHMHLSDNFGINDNHLPPGWAKIDWRRVFDVLSQISYSGVSLLEITNTSFDSSFEKLSGDEYTNQIFKVIEKSIVFMRSGGVEENHVEPFCIKKEVFPKKHKK
jgi:sugar phosphate isomerase/epimerase